MNIKKYEDFVYERNFEISQNRRNELGNYIKKLREEKKLSLTQLADLTKINVADLHKIEHGSKNKVNPFQLKALSEILQVDYKVFYKMVDFLEEKDFNNSGTMPTEKSYSREELIEILSMYYPKLQLKLILDSMENLSKKQINDILLFIDFIKNKK